MGEKGKRIHSAQRCLLSESTFHPCVLLQKVLPDRVKRISTTLCTGKIYVARLPFRPSCIKIHFPVFGYWNQWVEEKDNIIEDCENDCKAADRETPEEIQVHYRVTKFWSETSLQHATWFVRDSAHVMLLGNWSMDRFPLSLWNYSCF